MKNVAPAAPTARATFSTSESNFTSICTVSEAAAPTQGSLAIALDYAARGFAVFPCLENSKAPACSRGFHDATTNPATLRRWFGSYHRYNVGVRTGLISGIWVLDVDGGTGAAALAALEAEYGGVPVTLTSVTSSGCHLWFRADRPLPSTVGRIGVNLDARADAAYVLAPPSRHPDGAIYRWTNDNDIALAPDWLVQRACRKPAVPPVMILPRAGKPARGGRSSSYGRAALERECQALVLAPNGTRNHALNRASFALHQLVAGGELDIAEVRDRLVAAATGNGLVDDDGLGSVEKTIASGARAGLQHPRSVHA
jgi:hypothetical protein